MIGSISTVKLRNDLEGAIKRVKGGETIVVENHGVPSLGLVDVSWGEAICSIGECDNFMNLPDYNSIIEAILRSVARQLEEGKHVSVSDIVKKIGKDSLVVLAGRGKERELGLKL